MKRGNGPGVLFASGIPGCALAAVLSLQIAIPAVALFGELPNRFGFQMYSAQGGVSLDVLDGQGNHIDVNLDDVVAASLRPELEWTELLPEKVCTSVPEAARVAVEQSGRKRVVQCD